MFIHYTYTWEDGSQSIVFSKIIKDVYTCWYYFDCSFHVDVLKEFEISGSSGVVLGVGLVGELVGQ